MTMTGDANFPLGLRHDLLARRVFNTPLLITPDVAWTIAAIVAPELLGISPALAQAGALSADWRDGEAEQGYAVSRGVGFIPIHGELVNRSSYLSTASGLTSYDALQTALRHAEANPQVRAIVLDVNSPGGEASGAMETAEIVRSVSNTKRVMAFVNSVAASAAYAIASGAEKIIVTPSSTVGSIGVVFLHLDRSKMLADEGLKPTLLHAGAHKIDGHPFAALEAGARARIQAQIDDVYDLMTTTVGKLRPKLGASGARKTEAGLFIGRKAVDAGLADNVGSLDTALALLSKPLESRMTYSRSPARASQDQVDAAWAETVGRISARRPPARTSLDQTTTGTSRRHQSQQEIDATWAAVVAELNATLPKGYRLAARAK